MNLKFDLKSKNAKLSSSDLQRILFKAWNKSRKIIFLIILLSFLAGGWAIWNQSISGSGWSQQRKQDFMNAQNKQVEFKENEFNKVKEEFESRQLKSYENFQELKDVFKSY